MLTAEWLGNLLPPSPKDKVLLQRILKGKQSMKRAWLNRKTVRQNPSLLQDHTGSGPNGVSLAPPAYRIDFLDRQHPNQTGLPDRLKSGVEALSGISMDSVKVHYNSSWPAQLNALAYAQGNNIYIARGQERHLPHEAWHVVQQAQGRVDATRQLAGAAVINDNPALEREAERMAAQAASTTIVPSLATVAIHQSQSPVVQRVNGGEEEEPFDILANLPVELLLPIFIYLSPKDLASLQLTNKTLKERTEPFLSYYSEEAEEARAKKWFKIRDPRDKWGVRDPRDKWAEKSKVMSAKGELISLIADFFQRESWELEERWARISTYHDTQIEISGDPVAELVLGVHCLWDWQWLFPDKGSSRAAAVTEHFARLFRPRGSEPLGIFASLPVELLPLIISNLSSPRDLANLRLTNKTVRDETEPFFEEAKAKESFKNIRGRLHESDKTYKVMSAKGELISFIADFLNRESRELEECWGGIEAHDRKQIQISDDPVAELVLDVACQRSWRWLFPDKGSSRAAAITGRPSLVRQQGSEWISSLLEESNPMEVVVGVKSG